MSSTSCSTIHATYLYIICIHGQRKQKIEEKTKIKAKIKSNNVIISYYTFDTCVRYMFGC